MKPTELADALLDWYAGNARELPWRGSVDPYAVWVSEIMLQQTRVESVIPYYERWMRRYPDIQALAGASQGDVLATWEGLGYYSRARNLHRAAQLIIREMGGELPRSAADLRELPGIGRYTAGAIASIAFNQDEPALDGNIRRVLARLFNITEPARSTIGERRLWELAAICLPPGRAGDYNQALMDLGATVCTPRKPSCQLCPLASGCEAYHLGVQEQLPVRKKRAQTPHYMVTAAVICRDRRVLIAQRPENGLLGGMWEFPGGKSLPGEDLKSCLQREIQEELGVNVKVRSSLGVYQHAYTHYRVTLHAFHCALTNAEQPQAIQVDALRWVDLTELSSFPMGKIDRQISSDLLSSGASIC